MRFLQKTSDGGINSGVTGYFLIEIKSLFSIVLLHFNTGTREAYHSHAFNALTFWLSGLVDEELRNGMTTTYFPTSIKYTSRKCFHRVNALEPTWALSFRGPWADTWQESRNGKIVTLTHGREEVHDV